MFKGEFFGIHLIFYNDAWTNSEFILQAQGPPIDRPKAHQ